MPSEAPNPQATAHSLPATASLIRLRPRTRLRSVEFANGGTGYETADNHYGNFIRRVARDWLCINLFVPRSQRYSDGSLVGAWRGKIQFKTGTFSTIKDLEFMYVFNAGGTMTESSNYSRECGSLRSRRTCRRQRNLHQCGVPWDHQYANGCGHVG